jgi:hypothetical protein
MLHVVSNVLIFSILLYPVLSKIEKQQRGAVREKD